LLPPDVTATPAWPIADLNGEQSSGQSRICSPNKSLANKLGVSKVKNAALRP
jgi:hypothetical protein